MRGFCRALPLLFVVLSGSGCGGPKRQPPATGPTVPLGETEITELSPPETFGLVVERLVVVGRDSVLALESHPSRVVLWEKERGPQVLFREGPGPRELSARFYNLSRLEAPSPPLPAGAILLHALGQTDNLVIWPPDAVRTIRSERSLCSLTSLAGGPAGGGGSGSGLVASFYTSADRLGGRAFGGSHRLGDLRWQIDGDGRWHWRVQDTWSSFDYGTDPALNLARTTYTRLLPLDRDRFYFIECVGADSVIVFRGHRPSAAFRVTPSDRSVNRDSGQSPPLQDQLVFHDVDLDRQHGLHALVAPRFSPDGADSPRQEIHVYGTDGTLLERHAVDAPISAFAIDRQGPGWYGVDARESRLLYLSPVRAAHSSNVGDQPRDP